jgi:hypothetical protein
MLVDVESVEIIRSNGSGDLLGATRRRQLMDTLVQQRRRWDERRPASYLIRVLAIDDCLLVHTGKGSETRPRLVIRDTIIVGREEAPLPSAYAHRCPHEWRVEDLFRDLARAIADTTVYVGGGIQYDPAYGFPRFYWTSPPYGRGSGTLVESFAPAP